MKTKPFLSLFAFVLTSYRLCFFWQNPVQICQSIQHLPVCRNISESIYTAFLTRSVKYWKITSQNETVDWLIVDTPNLVTLSHLHLDFHIYRHWQLVEAQLLLKGKYVRKMYRIMFQGYSFLSCFWVKVFLLVPYTGIRSALSAYRLNHVWC
jgi:hypothetical protein